MLFVRAAITVLVAAVLCMFLVVFPSARAFIWSGIVLDLTVVTTVLIVVSLVSSYMLQSKLLVGDELKTLRDSLIATGGILLTCAALYVSYASFRNQTRLTAQQALNEEGSALLQMEMSNPTLRCIYYNYGFTNEAACKDEILSNPDEWSKMIFYVEETWYALQRAQREYDDWGSDYSDTIAYWMEDVERDPLGLFAYYLVTSSDTLAEAVTDMKTAGVHRDLSIRESVRHLCERFLRVWIPLGSRRPRALEAGGGVWGCIIHLPERQRTQLAPIP
jgi:hypothetical protein